MNPWAAADSTTARVALTEWSLIEREFKTASVGRSSRSPGADAVEDRWRHDRVTTQAVRKRRGAEEVDGAADGAEPLDEPGATLLVQFPLRHQPAHGQGVQRKRLAQDGLRQAQEGPHAVPALGAARHDAAHALLAELRQLRQHDRGHGRFLVHRAGPC